MQELSLEAQEQKRIYKRQYRLKNRDRINAQQREWRASNPDRVREYQNRYWEKLAGKRNIRAGWQDYGISKERYKELQCIVRSGEYAGMVSNCANRADEKAAGHIILSVAEGLSYDRIEFDQRLGRCPAGKSNFYGLRRLFFHYLDCELKRMQTENGVEGSI